MIRVTYYEKSDKTERNYMICFETDEEMTKWIQNHKKYQVIDVQDYRGY